jgi:hypothetical protein
MTMVRAGTFVFLRLSEFRKPIFDTLVRYSLHFPDQLAFIFPTLGSTVKKLISGRRICEGLRFPVTAAAHAQDRVAL